MVAREQGIRSSWGWLLALFTLAAFIDAEFYGQIMAFTPLHLAALGLDRAQVTTYTGLLASLTWAVGIPLLPLWGALADRYARQPVIARSFLAFFVAGIFMLIPGNLWCFALGRAVMNFALGNSGLMMTTIAERVPQARLGLAFAIMNSAAPIGYFAGPLVGGIVIDAWGFQALLAINMVLVLLVALAIAFGYHDPYVGKSQASLWRMSLDSVSIILRSTKLRGLLIAMFALFLGWQALLPYIPLAITHLYLGADTGRIVGLVIGLSGLVTMIIGPGIGALADRYGRWRVLFGGAALAVGLLLVPMLASSLLAFTLAWSAANGMVSAILALSFTVLSDATPPATRGRVMSFSWLPINLSAAVGPAIGSALAHDNIWWLFPLASLLTAIGIGVLALAAMQIRKIANAPAASDSYHG